MPFARLTAAAVLTAGLATTLTAPAFACDTCGCTPPAAAAAPAGDLVATAASVGTFETLLAAATAAGLVETLQSEGPLTVLAPTDAAFAALPEGTVADLLKPENKDKLVAVLTYHVIPGKVLAADALGAGTAETVQGQSVTFASSDHDGHAHATVNGVNISATDVMATNGVIHVIDAVLLPPAE